MKVKEYYADLYRKVPPSIYRSTEPSIVCSHGICIGSEENTQPLIESEVTDTIRELRLGKAPGLDGLPAEFYMAFWDLF